MASTPLNANKQKGTAAAAAEEEEEETVVVKEKEKEKKKAQAAKQSKANPFGLVIGLAFEARRTFLYKLYKLT